MTLKTTLLAATGFAVAVLTAAPALAQQYYAPPPAWHEHHHWHHGDHYYGRPDVVYHWEHFHLYPPPYGFEWVRDGHQFLLIKVSDGWIRDVVVF